VLCFYVGSGTEKVMVKYRMRPSQGAREWSGVFLVI